jgi:hypothetical protein
VGIEGQNKRGTSRVPAIALTLNFKPLATSSPGLHYQSPILHTMSCIMLSTQPTWGSHVALTGSTNVLRAPLPLSPTSIPYRRLHLGCTTIALFSILCLVSCYQPNPVGECVLSVISGVPTIHSSEHTQIYHCGTLYNIQGELSTLVRLLRVLLG